MFTIYNKFIIIKILSLFLLSILTNSAKAQYHSIFGSTQTEWGIAFANLDILYQDTLHAQGDSIVNNETYTKVFSFHSNNINCLLREDSTHTKLYSISTSDNIEREVMNLELMLGDSFYFNGLNNISPGWKIVDSVYSEGGVKIIRFNEDNQWNEKIKFIEGVGPNICFNYQALFSLNQRPYLICGYKDDENIFNTSNSNFLNCDIIASIKDLPIAYENIIYPNPVNTKIYLKDVFTKDFYHLQILNIKGELILETTQFANEIDVSGLINGIYFVKIGFVNHKQSMYYLIKQ